MNSHPTGELQIEVERVLANFRYRVPGEREAFERHLIENLYEDWRQKLLTFGHNRVSSRE